MSPTATKGTAVNRVLTFAATELKLFFRDPAGVIVVAALPVGLVLVFGLSSSGAPPGGSRSIPAFLPALGISIALGMLALFTLPSVLGAYRERGVLRRLATTPVSPAALLGAQLLVQAGIAVAATGLVATVAVLALGLPAPANPLGLALSLVLGIAALFSIGLLVAALAPNAKAAGGLGPLSFFPQMFLAGFWMPWEAMPDWLAAIGRHSPLGATLQTVVTSWMGGAPAVGQLLALGVFALVAGVTAVRLFRWV
ncbi:MULTISPECIES: ABC transporter permease [unclassified Crossiella]|uniref:ABC transporter permease n=1 Tax=unclassified Crossiella TaxID=2620835 RepID=UPI001FFF4EEB|nr:MULTISPECIES: ABC transporter permease [unclassified Crossiella]MCK2244292.1 ABC transporter permease [Crossiella sp. S99.2]MCK2257880.1 ABC transporter permease [Crossiella sp. S99.1]